MMENRTPPSDPQAEMSVLFSLLMNNSLMNVVEEVLHPEDFYGGNHSRIFKTMVRMHSVGAPIDMVTLREQMEKDGTLETVGGAMALLDLSQYGVYADDEKSVMYKANIVRDKAKYRQLINIGNMMMARGYNAEDADVGDAISESMSEIIGLALSHKTAAVPIGVALDALMKEIRSGGKTYIVPPGVPFARCKAGDLVVVAAGTAVGKTALTLNWADEWSKHKNVVYFEYEMPESDLMARLVCKYSGVELAAIQDGTYTVEEEARINDTVADLKHRKLKIEEVWCNINTLMSKIRKEVSQGAEMVIIDHMGLIGFDQPKNMNTAKAYGKMITNPLKNLAAELGIIIVLLVQLNREGQKEDFPKLYHLRDSGEIEQDASVVLMLWSENTLLGNTAKRIQARENSKILTDEECQEFGDTILIRVGVEKNRNGRTGEHFLLYHGPTFSYEDRNTQDHVAWATKSLL